MIDDPSLLPAAPDLEIYRWPRAGYIGRVAAEAIGRASNALGAGRATLRDPVDHAVGVIMLTRPGDRVAEHQPLLELHHRGGRGLDSALELCRSAIDVTDAPPSARAKVLGEIR